jgi:DNA-binding GntR family transcriptional regulator
MRGYSITADLKAALLTGQFKPGSELIQADLAERYSVSRIPVRDALRELSEEGLVVIGQNGNARVIALSREETAELYDLRVLLECDCLERAALRLDDAVLKDIDRLRLKADLDATTPGWAAGDWDFHRSMYEYAQRPRQLKLIACLRQTSQFLVTAYQTLPLKKTRWLEDHRMLTVKLRERDVAGAVATLRSHIEGARNYLLSRMD